MKLNIQPSHSLIVFVLFASILSSCLSLDDVAGLTKLADSAEQTLPAVVADIPLSCQRQNAFINDIPTSERPPSVASQDCKAYQDVADHLSKDQNVLIAYFDALGKLAANTPLSYDTSIDTNVATIAKIPTMTRNAVAASSAAQDIAKVLVDAATHFYRERKVNAIVLNADAAVQELAADLKKAISEDYFGLLSNEAEISGIYYQSPIEAAQKTERLALILVQRQYSSDSTALSLRKTAATNYGKVMDNLAALHAKLKDGANKKANLREIAQQVAPYVSSLKDAISQLQGGSK